MLTPQKNRFWQSKSVSIDLNSIIEVPMAASGRVKRDQFERAVHDPQEGRCDHGIGEAPWHSEARLGSK